jgi:hypothetical protein
MDLCEKWNSSLKLDAFKGDLLTFAKTKVQGGLNENEQIAASTYLCIIRSFIGNIPL